MTCEVNHNQLKEHIKKSYKTKVAAFIKGTMGIGKSDTIKAVSKEIAKEEGLPFLENGWSEDTFGEIDIRLSQYNPEDLKGLPMFNQKDKTTEWLLPDVLPRAGKGIIFFDEINLATPSIQAAAYQLILDRRLGNYKVPDGWAIIAAGNGTEDRANIFELPAPLKNRFAHVKLRQPTTDEWTEWAAQNGINNNIISFLNFKLSYLFTYDSNSDQDAFATPRSWTFVSRMIEGETEDSVIKRYVASGVGDGIASEYVAYHKMARELDIDKIIENAKDYKSPKEINLKYAIAGGLAERYNKNPKVLQNLCKIWLKENPEFAVVSMKMCKAYKPREFIKDILKLKEWETLSQEYSKYLL